MAMAAAKYMNPITLSLVFINFLGVTVGELQRFEHPSNSKPDGSLSFLVIGDWGRRGLFNQSQVASQMAKVADDLDIDFVVSTGDNFYSDGLVDENDPNFDESFSRVYTAHSLQKQWYSVLGNHDYRGNVEAQLSPVLRNLDSRWLCLRSFIVNADLAEIVFVDTTPFVESYFTDAQGHTYGWRGIKSRQAYIQTLLADVDLALRESTAKWKIVVGHHAIRSVGHHGDTAELVDLLLPVLERNGVDFYMNGHDHCLEHISDTNSGMQLLTSGAGSKAWRGDAKAMNRKDVKFFYDGQGFMSVYLTRAFSEIVFYDVYGETLHKFGVPKLHYHSAT